MNPELRNLIVKLLDGHRIMTAATNRPDGWPQATTVAYVNDGMLLYFFVARMSQKFDNLKRDSRISAAIGSDFADPSTIQGLSLAGKAVIVEDRTEYDRARTLFLERFPQYASWPQPSPATAPLVRLAPEIISVVDYSKGFGHSDLVTVSAGDLATHRPAPRSDWLGGPGR